jgi:hypothetical protein
MDRDAKPDVQVPRSCRCWMVRGEDLPLPPVCDHFAANEALMVAGAPGCRNCTHPEACHPAS